MKKLLVLIGVAVFVTSCNNGNSPMMNNGRDSVAAAYAAKDSVLEKNKATALASVQAFSSGKLDEAFKDVTSDVVDYGDGMMAPMKGRDSIISMVKVYMAAFPDYKGDNFLVVGDGNHVAVF